MAGGGVPACEDAGEPLLGCTAATAVADGAGTFKLTALPALLLRFGSQIASTTMFAIKSAPRKTAMIVIARRDIKPLEPSPRFFVKVYP